MIFRTHPIPVIAFILTGRLALAAAAAQDKPAVTAPGSDQSAKADIELARASLSKYYDLQRTISKERGDWKLDREILGDRVALLESQIKELKARTKEEEGKITEADKERAALVEKNEALGAVEEVQKDAIRGLEIRVQTLAAALPNVLLEKVRTILDRMPTADADGETIRGSVSQRFQNVIGVLNEVNKFNGDLHLVNERHLSSAGKELEVQTLYFGLSQGYFASGSEDMAEGGNAAPNLEGWKWRATPEISDEVRALVKMYDSKLPAEFVNVPVEIK